MADDVPRVPEDAQHRAGSPLRTDGLAMMGYHAINHIPHVEVFQRADDLFDWRLVAGNGEEMCGSLQGFKDKWSAKASYETAMILLGAKPEVRYKTNGE